MISGLTLLCLMVGGCGREAATSSSTTMPTSAPTSQSAPAPVSPELLPIDRQMRIMLLSEARNTALEPADSFNIVDADTREILRAAEGPRELFITFTDRETVFESLGWRTSVPIIDVVPFGNRPVRVKLIDDWKDFRGAIRLVRKPEGGAIVNLLDIEEYLVGVVSSELLNSFQRETFRVQAIAARTYAWYLKETYGRKRDWDLTATERSQVYRGLERILPKAADAVRDTRGLVCTWSSPQGEKIFCTFFSSRCGGTTAEAFNLGKAATIRPLAGGVACAYCRKSDAYRWPQDARFTKQEIGERLANRYQRFAELGPVDSIEVTQATADGRALRIAVYDDAGESAELEGESFRLTVDPTGRVLQSTCFEVNDEGDSILFTGGRGLGHGMGLCQYGAEHMARVGRSVTDILRHYYPGSRVTRAY